MAETEQFLDEIFDRIFKQEVDDGDFENPVDEFLNNFGKSIYFLCENIKSQRVTVKVQKNFINQNKHVK